MLILWNVLSGRRWHAPVPAVAPRLLGLAGRTRTGLQLRLVWTALEPGPQPAAAFAPLNGDEVNARDAEPDADADVDDPDLVIF